MKRRVLSSMFLISAVVLAVGCSAARPNLPVDKASAIPGGTVTKKGAPLHLMGQPVVVGSPLPSAVLVEGAEMTPVNLAESKGSVLFLSVVPSIDTKVCETQTHILAEEGDRLPKTVQRIVISRDTPFAQARFREESGLEDVRYLSDFQEAAFGKATGLLIQEARLLARSVIVVDRDGIVRYIQVVPDITHLPDMETAFLAAEKVAGQ